MNRYSIITLFVVLCACGGEIEPADLEPGIIEQPPAMVEPSEPPPVRIEVAVPTLPADVHVMAVPVEMAEPMGCDCRAKLWAEIDSCARSCPPNNYHECLLVCRSAYDAQLRACEEAC